MTRVMTKIDAILDRLSKVKKTGARSWLACCPSHDDHSPSLTLREGDNGTVLLRCWAGCSVDEIRSSLGLSWDDLFPEKIKTDHTRGMRRPFPAADILAAMADDAMCVAVFAANLGKGILAPEDYVRMLEAAGRIVEARRVALG